MINAGRLFDRSVMPKSGVMTSCSIFNAENECVFLGVTFNLESLILRLMFCGFDVVKFSFNVIEGK